MKKLLVVTVWMLLASFGVASTVWNPAANGISPPAFGHWNTPANWTQGLPSSVADGKAVFNVSGAAECRVTNVQTCGQFVQGDNGAGGVLRVANGGVINTSNTVWTAVGYNRTAQTVVETGGVLTCGSHLWIGNIAPSVGTLDINGGIVNVGAMLGLGWSGGTGYVNLRSNGILNLTQFHTTQSISGASVINIESGALIIPGDVTSAVRDYIAGGKITGYGGSGTPIYDYDVSNPGKTTVKAIVGQIPTQWHVVAAQYSTNELIITPFDVQADFGIVADGETDVTDGVQNALILLGNLGGGALFLPAGHYRIDGNLVIPSGVTLRGDWQKPVAGQPIVGTILKAYAGRGDENATPFIKLNDSAGINGISIWYPEQLPHDIQPYPPTIARGGGATIENVTFVNAYFGYTTYVEGTTARPFVRNVYGTPLKTGLEFDCLADIGRIETVHFSPTYWAGSGLSNAPTGGEHAAWIYNHGTGLIVRRIDWSYSCYVTVEGYNIGFALRPGRYDGKFPNGQSYGFNLTGCRTGVFIEASAYAGYQFTRFNIQQAETGVYLATSAVEADLFHTCTINASSAAFFNEGTARVLMMSCDIQQGPVRMNGGYLSVINSDFAATPANHIELGSAVAGASILGNRFTGGARIIANTAYPVRIDHTSLAADPLPAYDYKKPAASNGPAKTNLYVVTEAPYLAQADGVTDDTAAFQAALAAAGTNGGGTVFVPAGNYRLNGTLTVPTGVELRGVFDLPNSTKIKGSLLNVYAGRGNAAGTPFIQLQAGSGIKGFTFHYPEQIYDELDTVNYGMVPYPFLLRGLGADVYLVNLSATIPYQLLDLATHRCDRHYVDYIYATALKTGIHVGHGAVDGQIHNCQFNPSSYTHVGLYYDSIPLGTSDNIHKILWRDATPYLFGHMTNEVLHQNFVFGGAKGFHLVPEGGSGPSGHCLGMGVDQCTIAMQIDDVGSGGLAPINSQIVTVDPVAGRYLETGASLTDTFRMFSSAGWGSHAHSAVINGGDVRLQLFHLSPAAKVSAFKVLNSASLQNLGGNLRENLPAGRPFLTTSASAHAGIIGNVINTTAAQMPVTSANVTSIGNLRVGESPTLTDRTWSNGSGTRAWNQGGNWSGGVVPGAANRATVGNNTVAGPIISAGTVAAVKNLAIGDLAGTNDQLEMSGGSLSTTEWLILGYGGGNAGTLKLSAGSVNIGGDVFVGLHGNGTVNLTGGSHTVAGRLILSPYAGATGTVNLNGGTLSVGSLYMTDRGSLDITAGTLLIQGDARAIVNACLSNGWLTAVGGTTTPYVDYDNLNPGKTTVGILVPPVTTTVWNPVANNLWTTHVNWTGGAAPMSQIQNLKVVFNVDGAQECVLSAQALVAQLSLGDNGTTSGNNLRLTAGADLTCGLNATNGLAWTGVGYNRPATLTVESGGQVSCRSHLWIGYVAPAVGTLDINGGTVTVFGMFGMGWSGGTGYVNVRNGGVLDLAGFNATQSITNGSVLNIESGTVIINGNQTGPVNDYIAAGRIVAYHGAGTVNVDYGTLNPGRTTLTASAPLQGYAAWASGWGVPIGPAAHDYDGDLLNNLGEYALNGNPTNALDTGSAPRGYHVGGELFYIHVQRNDDPNLVYLVETRTNLVSGVWTNGGYSVIGTNVSGGVYDEVTNRIAADASAIYVRLKMLYP